MSVSNGLLTISVMAATLSMANGVVTVDRRAQAQAPVLPRRITVDGVQVLQHSADALRRAPQWSVSAAPLSIAGGADAPDFDLSNASFVELLPDGRLVTLAPVGTRLLLFGPSGVGERVLGRRGAGPGELMAPSGLAKIRGDTLVIADGANNRLSWIVARKGIVATAPQPTLTGARFAQPIGALRDGRLLLFTMGRTPELAPDSVTRPLASVWLLDRTNTRATPIATLPDWEFARIETRYRGRRATDATFLRFSRSAVARVWDTLVATGSGDGYRVDLRDATGRVRSSIRVAIPRRAVTKAMRDSLVARALQQLEGPKAEAMVDPAESRRQASVAPSADSLPPYGPWFITPNRTLWVVDASAPGDRGGAATAFRQDGAIIARLTWSVAGEAVAFGDDRVVMRRIDGDGVVSMQVYKIEPRINR